MLDCIGILFVFLILGGGFATAFIYATFVSQQNLIDALTVRLKNLEIQIELRDREI